MGASSTATQSKAGPQGRWKAIVLFRIMKKPPPDLPENRQTEGGVFLRC